MVREQLPARVLPWFANNCQREFFRFSMGDQGPYQSMVHVVSGSLAHGVALLACEDPDYAAMMIGSHEQITKLVGQLQSLSKRAPSEELVLNSVLILGCIIETALKGSRDVLNGRKPS